MPENEELIFFSFFPSSLLLPCPGRIGLCLRFLATEGKNFFFDGMSCPEDNLPTREYGRSGCLEGSYGREMGEQVLWWGSECPTPGTEKTGAGRRARNLLLMMAEALSEVPSGWVGTWHQAPQGWEAGAMVQALTWRRKETRKKHLSNSGPNTRNPFFKPPGLCRSWGYGASSTLPHKGAEAYSSPAKTEIQFLTNPGWSEPIQV